MCFIGLLILLQGLRIQLVEGEELMEKARMSSRIDTTEGERGNLYADNNKLLATSLPFFELRLDTEVAADTLFTKNVDSLATCLAKTFKEKTKDEYLKLLLDGRKEGKRYLLIKKDANYNEKELAKSFPIFNRGRYKGGFIIRQYDSRVHPFQPLAGRTIGYVRKNSKPVGIEGTYNKYLSGETVAQSMFRVNGEWVPMFDDVNMRVRNGMDVYTTINIDMQDKVQQYLMQAVLTHQATWGCAIVMEVETGAIKAISNLGLNASRKGHYRERYNYAVGYKSDPGSTFKLVSLLSLLEDGFIGDSTLVNLGEGVAYYHDHEIRDSWYYPGSVSVRKMMEMSSNVGISKLITKYYGAEPKRFIQNLQRMNISNRTGVDIMGEVLPTVKSPEDDDWSGITLPWMSMGHEVELTPLQMLTFVNAVGNDGRMMRPYLAKKIAKANQVEEIFEEEVLRAQICSKENAQVVRSIMEDIVKRGTAKKIALEGYRMGAKTGTAEIASGKKGYMENYQASIVGLYPIEQPKYSCIVVIHEPKEGGHYGGSVAGPVFQNIVVNCLASRVTKPALNNEQQEHFADHVPIEGKGFQEDYATIYDQLNVPNTSITTNEWITPIRGEDTILLKRVKAVDQQQIVPNVIGMGLRDAIYILENKGLRVRFTGRGKVKKQAPSFGARFKKGEIVALELG